MIHKLKKSSITVSIVSPSISLQRLQIQILQQKWRKRNTFVFHFESLIQFTCIKLPWSAFHFLLFYFESKIKYFQRFAYRKLRERVEKKEAQDKQETIYREVFTYSVKVLFHFYSLTFNVFCYVMLRQVRKFKVRLTKSIILCSSNFLQLNDGVQKDKIQKKVFNIFDQFLLLFTLKIE